MKNVVGIVLLCFWVQFSAVAAPPPEPIRVPTVVVHGEREVDDEAAPSTVIKRSSVTDAVADLPEILDEQPGLRTSSMGGLNRFSMLSIRGSTSEQVLVYVDGIPLNSAEGGPVDMSSIPLGPVDRVIIYRGVSPILYGGSAIGGVVDIRTRELDGERLELQLGGGSFLTRQARAFFGQGGNRWAFGIALDYLGTRGDFEFVDDQGTLFDRTDDRNVRRKNNHSDQVTSMLKGRLNLSAKTTLSLLNLTTWRDLGIPGIGLHPTEKAALSSVRNLTGLRFEASRLGFLGLHLSVVPFLSWSTTRFDDPLSEVGLTGGESEDSSWVPGVSMLLEAPLLLDAESAYLLTPSFATEYRYERFQPGQLGDTLSAADSERHRMSAAGELQLLMEPLSLELVGSLRYEADWSALVGLPMIARADGHATRDVDTHQVTWRTAFVYTAPFDLQLKLNVAANVRVPSLFELFGNTGAVRGNLALEAEKSTGGDIGLVWNPTRQDERNSASFQLFAFMNSTSNLIQFVQNSQNVSVAQNVAKARLSGVELGSYCDVLGHLRFRGNLTWLTAENRTDTPSTLGKRLPHRPRWKLFGRLEGYSKDHGVLSEVGAHLSVEYLAHNYLDPANLVEVPERYFVGAGVYSWMMDRQLLFDVTARNLSNNQVQDFAGYPLPGVTVMGSLRWAPQL